MAQIVAAVPAKGMAKVGQQEAPAQLDRMGLQLRVYLSLPLTITHLTGVVVAAVAAAVVAAVAAAVGLLTKVHLA